MNAINKLYFLNHQYQTSNYKKAIDNITTGNTIKHILSFATLTQEEQKYANLFLHDLQTGDVSVEPGKTLRDYISEYMQRVKNDQIHRLACALGLDEYMLRNMMALKVDHATINEYGRLDHLKATVDRQKAKKYFESIDGIKLPMLKINMKVDTLLRDFIIGGGFTIRETSDQYPLKEYDFIPETLLNVAEPPAEYGIKRESKN